MNTAFVEAAREWSRENPRFVEKRTIAEEKYGIVTSTFSSVVDEIACRAAGLPVRKADDIDLLVPRDHFKGAVHRFGAVTTPASLKEFTTGDGQHAAFTAVEAKVVIGGKEIQFMNPLGLFSVGDGWFNMEVTPEAVAARTIIETNEGLLALAHPADSIGMWALCRREGAKDDAGKVARQLALGSPLTDPYATLRAEQMGWANDPATQKFIERAGLMAMEMVTTMPQFAGAEAFA